MKSLLGLLLGLVRRAFRRVLRALAGHGVGFVTGIAVRGRFIAGFNLGGCLDGFLGDRLGRSFFTSRSFGGGFLGDRFLGDHFLSRKVGGVGRSLLAGLNRRSFL